MASTSRSTTAGPQATIFDDRAYVEAGGLVNYGADWMKLMELTGGYAARVLKGEKPADLPIQQATKFEMVINLKTAKALGLSVPQKLQLLADDVVE
jgi:putative ABC transport system substrate-binding protein